MLATGLQSASGSVWRHLLQNMNDTWTESRSGQKLQRNQREIRRDKEGREGERKKGKRRKGRGEEERENKGKGRETD